MRICGNQFGSNFLPEVQPISPPPSSAEADGRRDEKFDVDSSSKSSQELTTPAMPAKTNSKNKAKKYWLVDTGCPVDLVCRKSLPENFEEKGHELKEASEPLQLETANGVKKVDQTVSMQIATLNDTYPGGVVNPYLLDSTPDVLSVGSRCVKEGFAFHWEPYSKHPYFVKPSGKRINLVSIDEVPYLVD